MNQERKGGWIQTYTGKQFYPMDPRPEDIEIEDIAHSLSLLCRYNGHCNRFYSVAEHSVLMANHVHKNHALWALLHDASEAYLADVPRPVKPFINGYLEAENQVMKVVIQRFRLAALMPAEVKVADTRILADEASQNMGTPPAQWKSNDHPLGVNLHFWTPYQAETEFLYTFNKLIGK